MNACPVLPDREGRTQSIISIPLFTAPTISLGFPTPIKYLGLSAGNISGAKSKTRNIASCPSPTARPPIAYPSNSIDWRVSALSARKSYSKPPCCIPNSACPGRSPKASLERLAHLIESCMLSAIFSYDAGKAGHSSKHMTISLPNIFWISIDLSGLKTWRDPSMWDLKVTPSSFNFLSSAKLITWKPPLSVSIGRSQFINLWRPPNSNILSAVGLNMRWYVFPNKTSAPVDLTLSGSIALTVAAVPTGIKAGVRISPLGVEITPHLAFSLTADSE